MKTSHRSQSQLRPQWKSFSLIFGVAIALAWTVQAQYLTNSFKTQDNVTNIPPTPEFVVNLQWPTNLVVFTTNGVVFRNGSGVAASVDSQRNYVATTNNTYNLTNFDASVEVTSHAAFGNFFGIGQGATVPPATEPVNSIYLRGRFTGAAAQLIGYNGLGNNSIGPNPEGGAPFSERMVYNSTNNAIYWRLIKGGVTYQLGPFKLNQALIGGYTVFIGGNNFDAFTNLVVREPDAASIPVVTNAHFTLPTPTLYVGFPAPKNWVSADFNVGSIDITTAAATSYTSEDPLICSVAANGVLSPAADGIVNIIATNSDWGVSATQSVVVVSSAPSFYGSPLFSVE